MFKKRQPSEDAQKVVVGGQSATTKSRRLNKKSRQYLLFGAIAIIAGIALAGFIYYRNKTKTVTIDGEKIKVKLLTTSDKLQNKNTDKTNDQAISDLEAKIDKQPTYSEYLSLAQLYTTKDDKAKALEYYKKARDSLSPKDEHYQSNLDSVNATIKAIEAQ